MSTTHTPLVSFGFECNLVAAHLVFFFFKISVSKFNDCVNQFLLLEVKFRSCVSLICK